MTTDRYNTIDQQVVGEEIDGRYRLDRFLGAGTMGSVYEATQLAVGRKVAVKILNAALQTNDEVRERFRVEAQAIASLSHPHCVTLFDFGYSENLGALYMVIEYLEGHTLGERVLRGFDTLTALQISQQVASALAHAHDSGIVHRDLKPENVMVTDGPNGQPQVKVLDFGLARIFEDQSKGDTRLTRQGQLFGSPAYMSPEQCGGALHVGPEADVYSLGVSMFEMVTGDIPFVSDNIANVLVMHASAPVPTPVVAHDMPEAVTTLIQQMMRKLPETRPTAEEVNWILKRAIAQISSQGDGDAAMDPSTATDAFDSSPPTEPSSQPADADRSSIQATVPPQMQRDKQKKIAMAAVALLGLVGVIVAVLLAAPARSTDSATTELDGAAAVAEIPDSPLPSAEAATDAGPAVGAKETAATETRGSETAERLVDRVGALAIAVAEDEAETDEPGPPTTRAPNAKSPLKKSPPKGRTSKNQTSKNETSKNETSKNETSKNDTSKNDTSKNETSKGFQKLEFTY